jgi:hypothetical protein
MRKTRKTDSWRENVSFASEATSASIIALPLIAIGASHSFTTTHHGIGSRSFYQPTFSLLYEY